MGIDVLLCVSFHSPTSRVCPVSTDLAVESMINVRESPVVMVIQETQCTGLVCNKHSVTLHLAWVELGPEHEVAYLT